MNTPPVLPAFPPIAAVALALALAAGGPARAAVDAKAASRAAAREFFANRNQYRKTAGKVVLARDGRARMAIVIPADAPPAVRFAAEELGWYLGRVTGGDFAVADAPADGLGAIYLGDQPAVRKAGIDVADIDRDGYRILARPDAVFIAGPDDAGEKAAVLFQASDNPSINPGGPPAGGVPNDDASWEFKRGTLYGVYRFLEECGVRWFMPGPRGMAVPSDPNLTLDGFDLLDEPAFKLRWMLRSAWSPRLFDSHVPNNELSIEEAKAIGMSGVANRLWLCRARGSSDWYAFNHRPARTQWEARFGKEHPEYFAVRADGRRGLREFVPPPAHVQHLCYAREGVFAETVKDVRAYFSGEPASSRGIKGDPSVNNGWHTSAAYGDTVTMLPQDGYRGCWCDECLAKTDEDGPPMSKHSRVIWPFVARVAAEIEKSHPGKFLTCLAYSSYSTIPEDVDLPDNVIVGCCPRLLNKIYNLQSDEGYAELMNLVERLGQANEMPLLYWFHHLYRHRMLQNERYGVPLLVPRFYGRLIPDLARHGRMMFIEMDKDSMLFDHLNRYVVFRLLYNPNEDVEAIVDDYLARYYGPGAAHVGPVVRDVMEKSVEIAAANASQVKIWTDYYTPEVVGKYRAAADAAVAATRGGPHADAADLFSRFFVGYIERGRQRFDSEIAVLRGIKPPALSVRKVRAPIAVDGALDEADWNRAVRTSMYNNVDGKPTQWTTEVRLLRSDDTIYAAFLCDDPRGLEGPKGAAAQGDSVEFMVSPDPETEGFYQLWIEAGGTLSDIAYPNGLASRDDKWQSGARHAAKAAEGGWVCEVALPVAAIPGVERLETGRIWTALCCRSSPGSPIVKDRHGSISPALRGPFRQPEWFVELRFVD